MNDNFTASNGIIIAELQDPKRWTINPLNRSTQVDIFEMQALREFFRAEEDERLGRWRWPGDCDYVVTPAGNHHVWTVHEPTGMAVYTVRGSQLAGAFKDAARAYFDAHPEPKPWDKAKRGEVWAFMIDGLDEEFAAALGEDKSWWWVDGGRVNVVDGGITAGRRIWPEVSE